MSEKTNNRPLTSIKTLIDYMKSQGVSAFKIDNPTLGTIEVHFSSTDISQEPEKNQPNKMPEDLVEKYRYGLPTD